jgi:hypothetical protein
MWFDGASFLAYSSCFLNKSELYNFSAGIGFASLPAEHETNTTVLI